MQVKAGFFLTHGDVAYLGRNDVFNVDFKLAARLNGGGNNIEVVVFFIAGADEVVPRAQDQGAFFNAFAYIQTVDRPGKAAVQLIKGSGVNGQVVFGLKLAGHGP